MYHVNSVKPCKPEFRVFRGRQPARQSDQRAEKSYREKLEGRGQKAGIHQHGHRRYRGQKRA